MKRTFDGENESVQEYTAAPVVYELVDEIPDCTVQILRSVYSSQRRNRDSDKL